MPKWQISSYCCYWIWSYSLHKCHVMFECMGRHVMHPVLRLEKTIRVKKLLFRLESAGHIRVILGSYFFDGKTSIFQKSNNLHKIFNRNAVTMSYECMKNVNQVMKRHKQFIKTNERPVAPCNCRNKNESPMNGNCWVENVYRRCFNHKKLK